MSESLRGHVVAITGGAGGIGRALARVFTQRGARVALLDLSEDALNDAADLLHPRPVVVPCDVTDPGACQAAMETVHQKLGRIDILVNNAGISHRSAFVDTDDAVLRKVMEVNFFGSVNCTRAALPFLLRRRGQIVAVSSIAGFAPLIGRTGYAASKHAMHGFFDSLRAELVSTGVSVMVVCPYFTDTGLRTHALDGNGQADSKPPPSMSRPLTPEEVAESIVHGCENRSRQLVLGRVGQLSYWVSRVAPRAYEALMRRSQSGEA